MRKRLQINPTTSFSIRWRRWLAIALLILGSWWIWWRPSPSEIFTASLVPGRTENVLSAPIYATMDSMAFTYSPGWQVSVDGADPTEPADPWQEPAGRVTFQYQGQELALALAVGNYWGYLYVTVDGEPANLLPEITGNVNSLGESAGYRTFYVPEADQSGNPSEIWVPVHRSANADMIHSVEIEVWRSWGQRPLRGVAIDTLPSPPWPLWPAIGFLLLGGWLAYTTMHHPLQLPTLSQLGKLRFATCLQSRWSYQTAPWFVGTGLLLTVVGVWQSSWLLTFLGLTLMGWGSFQRPALWIGAFLLALPFYFTFHLPLLPGRAVGIVDVGIFGGFAIVTMRWLLTIALGQNSQQSVPTKRTIHWQGVLIALLASWALIAVAAADHVDVALREWRTVFGYGALFALTLHLTYRQPTCIPAERTDQHQHDEWWLVGGWLAGGTLVAVIALWHYASDTLLIQAEGVERVRAFYGSPNNLALYLERTFGVVLALALFGKIHLSSGRWWQWLLFTATAIQGVALVLTYSKGALLLALPTIFLVLLLGGAWLLHRQGQGYQRLWWLAVVALLAGILLAPSLATVRFQQLTNLDQGTGFIRLQLWRSSWQMALDHPWLGVGPDNFLYSYRSEYILPAAWQEPNLNHPHNWPLDWWTRLGLPGLGLALCWFGLIVWHQWQALQCQRSVVLALGMIAATAAALAHGLTDASYALPDLMVIWVLISYVPNSIEGNSHAPSI